MHDGFLKNDAKVDSLRTHKKGIGRIGQRAMQGERHGTPRQNQPLAGHRFRTLREQFLDGSIRARTGHGLDLPFEFRSRTSVVQRSAFVYSDSNARVRNLAGIGANRLFLFAIQGSFSVWLLQINRESRHAGTVRTGTTCANFQTVRYVALLVSQHKVLSDGSKSMQDRAT